MKVKDAFRKAVGENDAAVAGGVSDFLRHKLGMTYGDIYALAHKLTGVTEAHWDELMLEADSVEGKP